MSDRIERVSLTIPESLVTALDDVVEECEYSSRSKAMRDALRAFLTAHHWQQDLETEYHGSITIVYEHDAPGITETLLEVQHDVADIIVATQHVHFDVHLCLETLVVTGSGAEIRDLVNSLKAVTGMKQVQFTAV